MSSISCVAPIAVTMSVFCCSYSSPVETGSLCVSHFAYQEPENDPRSFCYLWVVRSSTSAADLLATRGEELVSVPSQMAGMRLYQLAYDKRIVNSSDCSVLFKV